MLILGLDSSAKAASCAVYGADEKNIIAYGGVNNKITHSETLMPLVGSVLKAAKLTLNDMDAFAVTNGPGSFTGVRISVSAVKGMAFALGLPVYPVSALQALAYNLSGQDCIACCLMDARRGQFYNALFRIRETPPASGEKITRLTSDRAIAQSEIETELSVYKGEKIILVGDGAELFYSQMKFSAALLSAAACCHQNAVSVCLAALENKAVTAKELMPLYLRLPQAERERTGS
ncbi:MAG: tRNA (adenosine(37)-N6)-threonylcarbamoyltransferase complex dimerization subunit type 1 TsaB [Oscillospiraceae bacterium]|nr:tRNA (adenosine(37)-N6)-threonylcarbamoyltransferase complex dimerization subunit type 1 TsaB [Oscillospiraceae bacterium]